MSKALLPWRHQFILAEESCMLSDEKVDLVSEDELVHRVGELVGFHYCGSRHRGRLLDIRSEVQVGGGRNVSVIVELPVTLIKLTLSPGDIEPAEPKA